MQSAASPSNVPRDTRENPDDVDTVVAMLRTKLSHDELAELMLAAAQEYFDACATLDDPDLELARQVVIVMVIMLLTVIFLFNIILRYFIFL